MKAEKIQQIKKYQQDYFLKFGERLDVDWEKMNGITHSNFRMINSSKMWDEEEAKAALSRACFEFKTSPDVIKGLKRIDRKKNTKEYDAVNQYIKWLRDNTYSYSSGCRLINKDRTTLHYYLRG